MPRYLLSLHTAPASEAGPPPLAAADPETFMKKIQAVEADLRAAGSFVFSARLHDPDTATVVRRADPDLLVTDGPYVEAHEHLAGFYIVDADDLDAALAWAGRVVDAVGAPIEVWPFVDTAGA
jgi:hypothetical protein